MDTKLLEDIGLTKGEIAVYFALLELGSSTVGPIVDKSRVSSSKAYNILERLIHKGLVSHVIKENTKYFDAASPKRILDYMKEKEKQLNEQTNNVEKIMPELLLKQKMVRKQQVNVFEGIKGIKTVREKSLRELKKGDEFYILGASASSNERLHDYWLNYHKRRSEQGIKVKLLMNQDSPTADLEDRNHISNTFAKYMPINASTPSWIEIYKDRTVIGVPTENPVAVEIENQDVAKSFKSYFEALWGQEVFVSKGFSALEKEMDQLLDELTPLDTWDVLGAALGEKGSHKQYSDFFRKVHHKRYKKGIKGRLLFQQGTAELINKYRKTIYQEEAEIKFLPYKTELPVATFLSKDITRLIIHRKEPLIIKINNKEVTESFRKNFEVLWNQDLRTLRGNDGIIQLCEEVLKENQDLYLIGANGTITKTHKDYFKDFDARRAEKGIRRHHLSIEETRDTEFNNLPNSEVHYLPKEFSSPMIIWVFGNKVAQVLWNKQIVSLTSDKTIADDYRKYFNLLWQESK
jgi:sugar-specific transcriptional regulator TrmB